MTPDPWCQAETHGSSLYAYVSGRCRCTPARLASSTYAKRRRASAKTGRPYLTDGTGTGRRIHALMAAGWSSPALAARLYVHKNRIAKLANQPRVHIAWADAITDLYNQIGLEEGPCNRARAAARKAGWPLPIEWGPDIDDPDAKPLRLDRIPRGIDMGDVELVISSGAPWQAAADRLGVGRKALDRRLHRAGRHDLVARLTANSETWRTTAQRNQWSA